MSVRFSIVMPTLGRETLERALKSCVREMGEGDEVLVVADGHLGLGDRVGALGDPRVRYFEHGPTHDLGHSQRDFAHTVARGTHCVYLDDDNVLRRESLSVARVAVERSPGVMHLFPVTTGDGECWMANESLTRFVCGSQAVVPLRTAQLTYWSVDQFEKKMGDAIRFGHSGLGLDVEFIVRVGRVIGVERHGESPLVHVFEWNGGA